MGIAAVLLAVAACGTGVQAAEQVRGRVLAVPAGDARPAASADLRFGLRLLDAWCRKDPSANIVFSPSSLATGLGMAALGAKGRTAAEMNGTLGLPAEPLGRLAARSKGLRGIPGVAVSDQVWTDKRLKTGQDYLDRVATGYGAGVKLVPLRADPEGARKTINASISDDTKGLIKELIPGGALGQAGWVLTDATYLKAGWESEFKHDDTDPGGFTTASGAKSRAFYLKQTGDFGYGHRDGWTAVRLAYKGGRLGMLALLPDGDGAGCPALDARTIEGFGLRTGGTRLALRLPKTDLSTKQELSTLLAGIGMPAAFSDAADFTGISPDATRLSAVRHAARLRVDEKGTEAAAATSVEVGVAGAAPEQVEQISFDRPHLLLIQDLTTGEPLFLARVADPSKH